MEATAIKGNSHGANVRRWREWRNVKQDVLADQIGVSQATLSSYEKKEKLDIEILEKIAKVLDVPVEAITELNDGASINIVANTFDNYSSAINWQPTFNPLDKIVELYEEKNALYERMLKEKEETISLLHEVLKEKK